MIRTAKHAYSIAKYSLARIMIYRLAPVKKRLLITKLKQSYTKKIFPPYNWLRLVMNFLIIIQLYKS